MRLVNTTTLQLETFHPPLPPYAILSHVHSPAELTPDELTTIATHRLRRQQELARIIPRSSGPDKADTMKLLLLQSMLLHFRGSHSSHRPPTPPPIDAPVLASAFEKALVPASLHSSHVLELKPSFAKISLACGQAEREGIQWIWIDSVCVNRESSAELTEAINSMWTWYSQAAVCYAFLEDVQHGKMRGGYRVWKDDFVQSRWFKRGWTLQELLAPRKLVFYGAGWKMLGTKSGLVRTVEKASGIDRRTLLEPGMVGKASVARRMAWASGRSTSLPEDMAYSLMGLFGVKMVPMYGEGGEEAFGRLQEEIIKKCDDQTIFAWGILGEEERPILHHTEQEEFGGEEVEGTMPVLARSPRDFKGMEKVVPAPTGQGLDAVDYGMTNKGVRIKLHMIKIGKGREVESQGYYLAALDCRHEQEDPIDRLGIFLAATDQPNVFLRTRTKKHTRISGEDLEKAKPRVVYISNMVGGFAGDGSEEEKLFVKASDLISPGYDIIDTQAKQAQWNREFCTMRLAGVAPLENSKQAVVYQLAVLMFFNRHLKSGLCVRIIVDQATNECFVDLVPPPEPRSEEEKRRDNMTPEEEDDEELNQLRKQARKLWENPGRVNLQRTKTVGNKTSMFAQTVDVVNPEMIGMEDEDDQSVAKFKMTPDGPPIELRPGVLFSEKWEKEYRRMVQATVTRKKRGVISLEMNSMLFAGA
ncbi:hypothetical protein OQA88_7641 [Cercophora sp. LCS_1]